MSLSADSLRHVLDIDYRLGIVVAVGTAIGVSVGVVVAVATGVAVIWSAIPCLTRASIVASIARS